MNEPASSVGAEPALATATVTRALVLGSGGLSGIAWEAGVIAGLADAGIPVASWDRVVGSSAGALVGARLLADGSTGPLLGELLALDPREVGKRLEAITGRLPMVLARGSGLPGLGWLARVGVVVVGLWAIGWGVGRADQPDFSTVRRAARARRRSTDLRVGLRALGRIARTRPGEADWIAFWSDLLGAATGWPATGFVVVAIDIGTGERIAIDIATGVPIASAVAASTALPGLMPPVDVAGSRTMDGGLGSTTNADLAAGCQEIVVVCPLDPGGLGSECSALIAGGANVRVIRPSPAAVRAMGTELARLDPRRVTRSGMLGREDGRAAAARFRGSPSRPMRRLP